MKVLYILHTTDWDGSAHSLLNMINALGDQIEPIVLFKEKCAVYDLYREKGINCIVCRFRNNIKYSIDTPLKYFVKITMYLIINLFALFYLYFKLRNANIDIIHSNSGVISLGYPLSFMLRTKCVIHLREFIDKDFSSRPLTGWKKFYKNLSKADAVIAITKTVFDHFNLHTHKNAFYVWNAVLSESAAVIKYEKEKYFLFCSAQLLEAKGIDFCLEAFAKSGLYTQGYSLIVLGKRVQKVWDDKLIPLINLYGIAENVKFIGSVRDIKPYALNATAFMMCSKNEGFGRVTAESMFYGCPVIARNSGGSAEFIKNNENGFLFDNMEDCVSIMKNIVTADCTHIIQNAQKFAKANFSEETYGNKILNIYTKTLVK